MLADNKIAANAGWDRERLALEIPELTGLLALEGIDSDYRFEEPNDMLRTDFELDSSDPPDHMDACRSSHEAITRPGDWWWLGEHRLLCADARDPHHLDLLLEGKLATMAFLDPPYNLKISNVVGRGRTKHEEFIMASGEMSREEYTDFLILDPWQRCKALQAWRASLHLHGLASPRQLV